jgi:hypothetical protein
MRQVPIWAVPTKFFPETDIGPVPLSRASHEAAHAIVQTVSYYRDFRVQNQTVRDLVGGVTRFGKRRWAWTRSERCSHKIDDNSSSVARRFLLNEITIEAAGPRAQDKIKKAGIFRTLAFWCWEDHSKMVSIVEHELGLSILSEQIIQYGISRAADYLKDTGVCAAIRALADVLSQQGRIANDEFRLVVKNYLDIELDPTPIGCLEIRGDRLIPIPRQL